ncbi:hypothetical protein [Vreelandella gomseomensis]|uniref:Uncharacterized protein n=1 Tax=Vreelandella gomseomensis TaxID=370766 RepID=A0ABU1G9T1_9GAMM|nr:hypothetical protein [Halomonas gomseomensis]MDR5873750.1 hypothetical protein [Halomonas gomseomensis]
MSHYTYNPSYPHSMKEEFLPCSQQPPLASVPMDGRGNFSNQSGRPVKLCKANLIRQIIRYSYWLGEDASGVHFLVPYHSGPVLMVEADMIAPVIKQIVADYGNRDVSDQSIRDALDIIRRDQAHHVGVGNGRTWLGENNERYIILDGVVMMFPVGKEYMIQPNQYYNYWQPTNCRPFQKLNHGAASQDIKAIDKFVQLPKDRELLIYSYILLCLMPERQQLALEITGEPKSGMARLQRIIKHLVDPVTKETAIREIPTTVKEVNRLAWRHHVLSLESVASPLSPVVQRRLFELLSHTQLEWKAIGCHEITTSLSVSRPCIISSLEPVIHQDELSELTLSLEMPSPSRDQPRIEYPKTTRSVSITDSNQAVIFDAVLTLLGEVHTKIDHVSIDRSVPVCWGDFCRIGMVVSSVLHGSPDAFWSQYVAYRSERLAEITEEEPIAQAILEYLKINDITEIAEKPVGVWLATLDPYRPTWALDHQWPREPRGLGAAFKRAAQLLDAQGITCYSTGKRGSKRHWVIGPRSVPCGIALSNRLASSIVNKEVNEFAGLM